MFLLTYLELVEEVKTICLLCQIYLINQILTVHWLFCRGHMVQRGRVFLLTYFELVE